jgi:predicted dehydrogenase
MQMHVPIRPADAYHEQMRNFSAVIRGTESPVLSGRDGTATLATTLAITQSARTGQPVRVDEMLRRRATAETGGGEAK